MRNAPEEGWVKASFPRGVGKIDENEKLKSGVQQLGTQTSFCVGVTQQQEELKSRRRTLSKEIVS
jgi:hypothetical protein